MQCFTFFCVIKHFIFLTVDNEASGDDVIALNWLCK